MDPALPLAAPVLSSEAIRRIALESGFDLCGFARVEPIPAFVLTDWLEAGLGADMDWMQERLEDRLDVTRLLPGARTVLSLVSNYHSTGTEGSSIARYARGRDYHATHKDRLRALRRGLKALHPAIQTYGGVDYAPMMEKVWATRAGLGYVGRNGCFITPQFGSWVLLATLALDVAVDVYAGALVADLCGRCNLCVSACPTEAILPGSQVDATRCLSYQTIENAEASVPEAFRLAMANVTFGCDLCQDICPHNQRPLPTAHPRFAPRAVAQVGVRELAAMTPAQYEAWVPGTALARAKYDGLRRNAAYALGAVRDEGARSLLEALRADPSEVVREAAEWALTQLG